jgi:hypothetical protein
VNDNAPVNKRRGWIIVISITLLLLLTCLLLGLSWWNSDADLVAVRERAVANNIPVTWSEFARVPIDPDRLARWERIVVLANKLPSYDSLTIPDKEKVVLFSPMPAALREHHATHDETVWRELLQELELLGDKPLRFHENLTPTTKFPEWSQYRSLMRLLRERCLLAEKSEAVRICAVQLALCRGFESYHLWTHLLKTSLVKLALESASHHLANFKKEQVTIAADIELTVEQFSQQMTFAFTGEFILVLQQCEQSHELGIPRDSWLQANLWDPASVRIGRQDLLNLEIDFIMSARTHDITKSLTLVDKFESDITDRPLYFPTPSQYLRGIIWEVYREVTKSSAEITLRGRLLASELQGNRWPTDIFDPTGAVLRPVHRAGKLVGAYTVYSDGKDDGGKEQQDRYFPLYGPYVKPVAPPVTTTAP